MRVVFSTVGIAWLGLALSGMAGADEYTGGEYLSAGTYGTDFAGLADDPAEAAVATPETADLQPAAVAGGACRSCCPTARCGSACSSCAADKPWKLPQPGFTKNLGIMVGGWLDQGITFSNQNAASGFNGPIGLNDLDGEYQMNQLWLYLTRPADNGGCGWALGGHVDMLLGTDWRFGINHGLENRINGFNRQTYGMVLPQAYLEVAYNDLSVKLGHFAGILDYEAVPTIANPFYSHSYCYAYTVPQLVVGVLADYKLNDRMSVQGGFHRGWMQFEDTNHDLDFMGGVKWNSCDKRTSLAYAISTGAQDAAGAHNRFVYSLVAKRQISEQLQYVAVHNLGFEDDGAPGGDDAEWYGLNQYLLYTINPRWSANMRFEWLRDDDGARIAGPGNIPGVRAFTGNNYAGDFYELTCGLSWRPSANLTVRPEVRWDWYEGLAGQTGLPFDDGASDDQFTFGVDAILTF